MNDQIELFYKKNNIPEILLKKKLEKFAKHKDIAEEFVFWINNGAYKNDGCVVEGYSAKKLADMSKYLDGEGAFILLIELRESPQKALDRISRGFKEK